jgi:ribose 5-phosphate isomerase B
MIVPMTIYLGADHGGFAAKEQLKTHLSQSNFDVHDLGATTLVPDDDYPVYAEAVARAVVSDRQSRGILCCRSGHGMVIAANKVHGARAALAVNQASVEQSRTDDNANILVFGVDFMDVQQLEPLTVSWLAAQFKSDSRFQRRLDQITALESLV